jgi:hypothetical protein
MDVSKSGRGFDASRGASKADKNLRHDPAANVDGDVR